MNAGETVRQSWERVKSEAGPKWNSGKLMVIRDYIRPREPGSGEELIFCQTYVVLCMTESISHQALSDAVGNMIRIHSADISIQ